MKIIYNINKKVLLQEAEQKINNAERAFNTTVGALAGGELATALLAQHNLNALHKRNDEVFKEREAFEAEHPDNHLLKANITFPEGTPDMQNHALIDAGQISFEKNPDYIEPPSFEHITPDYIDPHLAVGAMGAGALAGGAALYKATPAIHRGIDKIANYIRK